MMNLTKKHKWIINIISLVVIIGGIFFITSLFKDKEIEGEKSNFIPKVKLINVAQLKENNAKIGVTGLVASLEQVELKSQVSSKVKSINFKLGDEVKSGQILASFDNNDIMAQLLQAQANLDAENARLSEIKRGARTEEILITETLVSNAKIYVDDAKINLENTKNKADADLNNIYASSLTSLYNAVNLGKSAILTLSDIQKAHFNGNDQESTVIQDFKEQAVLYFLGQSNTSLWETKFLSELKGGVFGKVNNIVDSSDFENIDAVILEITIALDKVRQALESIPISDDLSVTEQTNLSTQKSSINVQITTITGKQQSISVQKVNNHNSISGAEINLNNAMNSLEVALNQLNLVLAGASSEQIAAQEARVKLARAGVSQVQAQLSKTIIRSPINGTLSVMSIRLGELISPGQIIASIVNTKGLEIKTYIDSEELSQINLGSNVIIENNIKGLVNRVAPSIDPSTKKIEVNIIVINSEESNLIVGQFVNIDILIDKNLTDENIYLIPLEAIKITPNKTVIYVVNNNIIEERLVVLGKIIGESIEVTNGVDLNISIISSVRGLELGQTVEVK